MVLKCRNEVMEFIQKMWGWERIYLVIKMADLRRPSRKGDSIGGVLVVCMHDVYDAHILIQLLTEGTLIG